MNIIKWMAPVPKAVRERLNFYNVPVTEKSSNQKETEKSPTPRKDHAQHRAGQPEKILANASFLTKLRERARPEDFVAVKVDIEGQLGAPELQIVHAIAEDPTLGACYHVRS